MTATQEMPKLATEPRAKTGTRYAARLREEGKLPAVVYGHKQGTVPVTLDAGELNAILHSHAHLVEVSVDGKTEPCLIKDVQWNHLGSQIIHVDLARVDLAEEVEVEVDLVLEGEPAAINDAGVLLEQPLTMLEIACRADSIPENITCDISNLQLGENITVSELVLPAGVKAVTDEDTVVAILAEAAIIEEEPAEDAGDGEPEVIGKSDDEGDSEGEGDEK